METQQKEELNKEYEKGRQQAEDLIDSSKEKIRRNKRSCK